MPTAPFVLVPAWWVPLTLARLLSPSLQEVEFLSTSIAQLKVVQTKYVEAKDCLNVLTKSNEGMAYWVEAARLGSWRLVLPSFPVPFAQGTNIPATVAYHFSSPMHASSLKWTCMTCL